MLPKMPVFCHLAVSLGMCTTVSGFLSIAWTQSWKHVPRNYEVKWSVERESGVFSWRGTSMFCPLLFLVWPFLKRSSTHVLFSYLK